MDGGKWTAAQLAALTIVVGGVAAGVYFWQKNQK